jgi:hypothetical protein
MLTLLGVGSLIRVRVYQYLGADLLSSMPFFMPHILGFGMLTVVCYQLLMVLLCKTVAYFVGDTSTSSV